MVIHAFPVAKLGALLIKQISKPVANAVKQGAKSSPVFRKYVCLPPANFYNWCEVKVKMWLLHLGQPVNITVLNEAASIELGANLLGESVIFAIAAGILLFEYNRGAKKEAAKEEARKQELQELKDGLRDLFMQTEQQGAYIRELTRRLAEMDKGTVHKLQSPKDSSKKEPPPEGPPQFKSQPSSTLRNSEDKLDNLNLLERRKDNPLKGVIFRALNEVEQTMFLDPHKKREPGVIITALNQLYRDVYKSHVTF